MTRETYAMVSIDCQQCLYDHNWDNSSHYELAENRGGEDQCRDRWYAFPTGHRYRDKHLLQVHVFLVWEIWVSTACLFPSGSFLYILLAQGRARSLFPLVVSQMLISLIVSGRRPPFLSAST